MTDTETPEVIARVEENWAALEIGGETQTIRADSEEEVRHEVLRRTIRIAADTNRDVSLIATDRDGEWRLIVSPQGEISETGTPSRVNGAHQGADATTESIPDAAAPSDAHGDAVDSAGQVHAEPPESSGSALSDSPETPEDTENPGAPETPEHTENPGAPETLETPETPDLSDPSDLPVSEPAADAGSEPTSAPAGASASVVDSAALPAASPAALPTLADFQATQPPPVAGPANQGWRGAIRRGTGGLISPKPGAVERRHREAIASVTRSLSGPRTICVINPKGGAHKTTATMLIAATFGLYRGGYTLAWDNNETRGTLGWRAHQAGHSNTAVNLLNDLDRFTDPRSARVGDLDNYVRSQAEAQFDVLASDEDAAASSMIDDDAFRRLHETLQRFYRIIVVDTGNNMRASNWEAAIAAADQLVIVSAIREDTAGGAAWMVEGLAKKGQEAKLRDAVTILSAPDKNVDAALRTRLFDHFGSLTRDVVEVPYDAALVSGSGISIAALSPVTREAWLMATATVANGL